jgi:hypothetical protein
LLKQEFPSRISVSNVEKIGIQQARWRQLEFSKQWVGQLESSKQCEGHSECFSFTLKSNNAQVEFSKRNGGKAQYSPSP